MTSAVSSRGRGGLYYRDEGEGPPVVLLHGMGSSSRAFDQLYQRRGRRRLISLDLPRSGRSGHWAPSTPGGVAEGVLALLRDLGVGRYELFGHSFGGLVALVMAERDGEKVDRLVVANAPALGVPRALRTMLAFPSVDLTFGFLGALPVWRPALEGYLRFLWGSGELREEQVTHFVEATQARDFAAGMLEAMRAVGEFRLPPGVRNGAFRKQVLWGAADRLVPLIQGEQLATVLGAPLEVWDGVGHCLPEEAGHRLAATLLGA